MSVVSGAGGSVEWTSEGTQSTLITEWTADIQRKIFEVSSFDNESNAKDKIGGTHKAVGTLTGFVDAAAMPVIQEFQDSAVGVSRTGHIELVATGGTDGTVGYEFDSLLSDIALDVPKQGMQAFSCSFQSIGAIAVVVTQA